MTAQTQILRKYGHPNDQYAAVYCELWPVQKRFPWFPAKKIFINKDFRKKLETAFANLERAGIQSEIKTFDGCYNKRKVRGSDDSTSLHAWAMAIDLNAGVEKLGQQETHWSGQFIAVMLAAGLYWGGNWHRKDPMHFALFNG
jgi:hypothetical protein